MAPQYEAIGHGAPIITLYGAGLDRTTIQPWHEPLADAARLVYWDLPIGVEQSRSELLALTDELGPATLLGHSSGVWLALDFARHHPGRVKSLVLVAAAPTFDYPAEVVANAMAKDPALAQVLIAGLQAPPASDEAFAATWRTVLPLYFHGQPPAGFLDRTRFSAAAFSSVMPAVPGLQLLDHIPAITAPMLVVNGAADFITPPSQGRRLVSLAQRATHVELPAAGHFPYVEAQERYLSSLRMFSITSA